MAALLSLFFKPTPFDGKSSGETSGLALFSEAACKCLQSYTHTHLLSATCTDYASIDRQGRTGVALLI